MSNFFSNIFKKDSHDNEKPKLSKIVADIEDSLNDYNKKMIQNVIELSSITAKEIMIPRVDVVSIDKNSELKEVLKIISESGRSRYPVYEDNIDNVVGVLHSKDLLRYIAKNSDYDFSKILRTPYFVPESKIINDLLVELRENNIHLVIVVDEYGGMSGLLCLEDLIEKIVGDIKDEFDNESEEIVTIETNKYLVNPRISLSDLNEKIGSSFTEDDIDTLGGLIFMIFGRIPQKNDKIEYKNYLFTIDSISGRKINKVKIEQLIQKEENEENL